MRRLIRYFLGAGFSYCVTALTIYLGLTEILIGSTALLAFFPVFYISGKLKKDASVSVMLGLLAIVLMVIGFVATGYALKNRA